MGDKQRDDQYSEAETEQRREDALRRMHHISLISPSGKRNKHTVRRAQHRAADRGHTRRSRAGLRHGIREHRTGGRGCARGQGHFHLHCQIPRSLAGAGGAGPGLHVWPWANVSPSFLHRVRRVLPSRPREFHPEPLTDSGLDYEATRRIKADPALKHIPIIVVTSYALSGDEAKGARRRLRRLCGKALQPPRTARQNSRIRPLKSRRG
jgi:hypothetical protein